MDIPDPVTEAWVEQAISGLTEERLTEAITIVRGRGGRQAELLDHALRRRDASVTEVGEAPGAGVGRPTDRPPGRVGELAVGAQFAGYVIEGVAGQGGMGVVYRARQLRPSRIVALKVISPQLAGDPDFRERFAHESESAASIEHSNVIPVYDVGEESSLLYLTMRYVDGTDLRAMIEAEGRLAPLRAAEILVELTAALDAAHAHGLVHRDVKPANVLIAREGPREHVYLTDFGLAKLAASTGRTRTGLFVGTLDYAAPEQLEGRRVDARTDVYAAGCVLYQMLTGSVPFPEEHEAAIMWAHISAQPRPVAELVASLPSELDAVIARAMAKRPEDRYASAGDLGRDAIAAVAGQRLTLVERSVARGAAAPAGDVTAPRPADTEPAPGPRTGPAARSRSRPRVTRRLAALSGGALAVIVIGVLAVTVGFGSSPHPARAITRGPRTTASKTTPAVPAPTTKTFTNAALGLSFAYPATWGPLALKGSPADFGINPGAGETRCAVVIDRGAGPASSSQEAQFAFVRARSASAAATVKNYHLRAIQAEQGANIAGVGLIRIADGEGAHVGFFFRGRDVYAFDCITPAAKLDQVDRQDFAPLMASVRIG